MDERWTYIHKEIELYKDPYKCNILFLGERRPYFRRPLFATIVTCYIYNILKKIL